MINKGLITGETEQKLNKLKEYIKDLGSLAVGFSGGVDSAFLLSVTFEVLGERAIAVTAVNSAMPEREMNEAKAFCKERGIRQMIVSVDPLKIDEFRYNAPDRCYHCKKAIFSQIISTALENGVEYVAEGSNTDDLGDYRPGLKAVEELTVKSPLREACLSKSEIRLLSEAMGLPTWDKPSYACLASRSVYGEEITEEKLRMIDGAEQFLTELGFVQMRVRLHGNIARIEVPEKDISRLAKDEIRKKVYDKFKKLGFMFVTLDMRGYKTGSMNELL